jgi:hypothetical protein
LKPPEKTIFCFPEIPIQLRAGSHCISLLHKKKKNARPLLENFSAASFFYGL